MFAKLEFIVFLVALVGITLLGEKYKKHFSYGGLATVVAYKLFIGFPLFSHLLHEWVIVTNIFCLLTGFALLSRHFEESHFPQMLPKWLPDNWLGGFFLLVGTFVLSAVLDNIAAALIGMTVAIVVFRDRVHTGYLVAIVAASNGGGSGSVFGDTTTTMMWLAGANPFWVLPAYFGAVGALLFSGYFASKQQHAFQPIMKDAPPDVHIDWGRLVVVGSILVAAGTANALVNVYAPHIGDEFPVIGVTVWAVILLFAPFRKPDWHELKAASGNAMFLLSLVLLASLMPVASLPPASAEFAFMLGVCSAFFDNIPLTALAIKQGGYDWAVLAYCVGYGGSLLYFGSSAGVAVCSRRPEAGVAWKWARHGWHVYVGYAVGFAILLLCHGWQPHPPLKDPPQHPATAAVPDVP